MKRSFINTLVLAGVFAVVLAWYLVYEKNIKKKQTVAEEQGKQLVTLGKDEIREIDYAVLQPAADPKAEPKYDTIKLKKTGNDWSIVEPVTDLADNFPVNAMASAIATTKQERIVDESAKDLEQYGLKVPTMKITVRKDSSSPEQVALIGKSTPVGYSVYAKTAQGNAVLKMPKSLTAAFAKSVKDIRNKTILTINRYEMGEVEMHTPKGEILLKNEKDVWSLSRENLPADVTETNKLLNAIVDMKAIDFASNDGKDLGKFNLSSPPIKITLTKAKENTKFSVSIGKVGDKVYVKRDDRKTVYVVDKENFDKINKGPADIRSFEVANFNRFDVKRIKLERGKDSLDLTKEKEGWKIATEPTVKLDDAKVDSILAKLQEARIAKYLGEKDKKLVGDPKLVVRLFEKKEKDPAETEKVTLKFGSRQNKQVAVERNGLDLPFLIKEDDFKKLDVGRNDLLKAAAPDAPMSAPKSDPKSSQNESENQKS